MELEIIKVDAYNLMSIINDPDVYVIWNVALLGKKMLLPIKDASIENALSDKNLVVRIKEK